MCVGECVCVCRVGMGGGDDVFSGTVGEGEESETISNPALEESFTIHLGKTTLTSSHHSEHLLTGAQLKSAHNIRLLCGHPLSLCRQKGAGQVGGALVNPERLQTAMSLYSTKLTCMVLMVDRLLNSKIEKSSNFFL